MKAELYRIARPGPGKLGIAARPRGGDWLDDELEALVSEGVDVVISLLTREEAVELGLEREEGLCRARGIDYLSFPVVDRGVPTSMSETDRLARTVSDAVETGRRVAIHCRAGIGRSTIVAACALIASGRSAVTPLETIAAARGCSVPDTAEQPEWLGSFENYCRLKAH